MQKNRLGNFPTRFIIEPKKIAKSLTPCLLFGITVPSRDARPITSINKLLFLNIYSISCRTNRHMSVADDKNIK